MAASTLPTVKLLLMGDSGTGKSSILLRFTDDTFLGEDVQAATIGVDFKHKFVEFEGQKMKLSIWDTAGQERFRTLTSSYYRGAQGVMMVFDVTNRQSFENLSKIWLSELQVYTDLDRLVLMIVGNKIDKSGIREVSVEEGQALAEELSALYVESSAKTKEGVKSVFEGLLQEIMHRPEVEEDIVLQRHVLAVGSPTRDDNAPCLC